ncbi:SusC/RagA family TonB-linked outer membrane protein [Niabella soli]|uniref:TonB-linked outer membrane protein n=1 Tax=Niabella soli DSM 19437 TaxID=929713 RepID=W0EYB4_9BACT|nr:SusC/RagA family TonB-linked outer membrane protein [Niabella soli]AHF14091.1 TonB-linked outer membrane protein [Niabella soli DSM 19437]
MNPKRIFLFRRLLRYCIIVVLSSCLAGVYGPAFGHTMRNDGLSGLAKTFFQDTRPGNSWVLHGTVKDEAGKPVPGATVRVLRTGAPATATDRNGNFMVEITSAQDTLEVSFVGYQTQHLVVGNQRTIVITLLTDVAAQNMEEVVVNTGYMTQRKADLTGAVSVVSAKELSKGQGVTNVLQSLQGVVPGLHITTDGNPTGNVGVQLRGLTNIGNTAPLIVIDGVPAYINLRDVNPENIASITVLKDAYSASIYGTQGGAGVILIETKKGKPGRTKIDYSTTMGFAEFNNKPEMMNTRQYGQAMWQAAVNTGLDPNTSTRIYKYDWHKDANGIPVLDKVTPIQYLNADSTMLSANTNWLDAISQRGIQQSHQLTVSSGSEKATSLFSLNYTENQGTQIYTGFKRFTARVNTEYKLLNNRVIIGENLEASHLIERNNNQMHQALVEPPIVPVHTTTGGWGGSAVALGMDDYWNPVRELTLNKDNGNNYNKLIGDVHASVRILKDFVFRTQLGLIYTDGYHRNIQFTFKEGGGKVNNINSVDQWYWREAAFDWANTLNYSLRKDKHSLDVVAGIDANKYVSENMTANRQGLAFENYDFAYASTATGNMSVSGGGDKYNLLSYFGKFNYSFNSRYLLSGSVRYDGSSKFGSNNPYALFPAISAGWRISQEDFLKDNDVLSDLKLRASWGRNGTLSNINSLNKYAFYGVNYNFTSYAIGGNETGNLPSGFYKLQTANPNLQWETTTQTDIGLDFGFLHQTLTGALDFYRKYTYGMLITPPYLGTIGEGGYQNINAANMTNTGVELTLAYNSTANKDFRYQLAGNVSYNRNMVNDLPASVTYIYGGTAQKKDGIAGHPWGAVYGFIADGLYQNQQEVDNGPNQPGKGIGRIRYKDISGPDGKPDGKIDYDYDRVWISDGDRPKVEFGLNINLAYKNLDFSMFWQGVAGVKVYDQWKTYSDFWNVWVQNGFNHPTRVLDAWTPANTGSTIPALSWNNSNDELRASTYFIEPGQYVKLRNIQLGYSIPKSLISKINMDRLYVFVMGQNVLMIKSKKFTGPDPENPDGSSYANPYVVPRTFKAGIQLSF